MRRLLYVPIVHDEADLGSAGTSLAQMSATLSGERRWTIHGGTMREFWESVATYLRSLDLDRLKVYQDGLAADGEIGRRIVEEAARRGSKNYQLVLDLMDRGAELRRTEDPALLLQERESILGLAQQESVRERLGSSQSYRRQRGRLIEKRDEFMAQTVNATLKEGEVGVLFIGAYHDVASHLVEDISVKAVKDPQTVRNYFSELLLSCDDRSFEKLARYMASPVTPS